jgi:asparagine synthase (glutamine-hydrolysing)
MSGIAGFVTTNIEQSKAFSTLEAMRDSLHHRVEFVDDELFHQSNVFVTRTNNNLIQKAAQPCAKSGTYVWLDGEFYNQEELKISAANTPESDAEILLRLYSKDESLSFLNKIDGLFAAVIYDTSSNKVHLISDRYGLRYLYWMIHHGDLVWASQIKAFLEVPAFQPKIDQLALRQFMSIGYMLENRTWFEGVELLSSGTILTWDIAAASQEARRYWWWSDIKPLPQPIDEEEVCETLGKLFCSSVERRSREVGQVGLTLSGGLDSRAILAAIPDHLSPVHAITVGKKGSDDVKFAASAAKVKGAIHHIFEISAKNWLEPRVRTVWYTDGQQDLQHMHAGDTVSRIGDIFSINLGGLAGDLIMGGSFLRNETYFRGINEGMESLFAEHIGCSPELLQDFNSYKGLVRSDYYFLQNRVRRFTYVGATNSRLYLEERAPFFDNELMEFVYGLPDHLRYKHHIYNRMLLRYFPDFFANIPWQKTRMALGWSERRQKMATLSLRVKNAVRRRVNRLGFNISDPRPFTDYSSWIRSEPARSILIKFLNNRDALYTEYLSRKEVVKNLNDHLRGDRICTPSLCRYLTVEIWLQQVFNKQYRSGI